MTHKMVEDLLKPRASAATRIHIGILWAALAAGGYGLFTMSRTIHEIGKTDALQSAYIGNLESSTAKDRAYQDGRISQLTEDFYVTNEANIDALKRIDGRLENQETETRALKTRVSHVETAEKELENHLVQTSAETLDMTSTPAPPGVVVRFDKSSQPMFWIVTEGNNTFDVLPISMDAAGNFVVHSLNDDKNYVLLKNGKILTAKVDLVH